MMDRGFLAESINIDDLDAQFFWRSRISLAVVKCPERGDKKTWMHYMELYELMVFMAFRLFANCTPKFTFLSVPQTGAGDWLALHYWNSPWIGFHWDS
jgi:hypothetical protein